MDDDHLFEEIEIEEMHQEGEMRAPTNIDQPAPTTAIGRTDLTADFPVVLRLAPGGGS